MALPVLPFLIKGAVVAVKAISAHGAAGAVAKGGVIAAKTYGTKAVAVATIKGLTIVGLGAWTYERFLAATEAVEAYDNGDLAGAAKGAVDFIRSCVTIQGNDVIDLGREWIDAGKSISDPNFVKLLEGIRALIDEADKSGKLDF